MAGTSYLDAPVCAECGNTPLFVKRAAKQMSYPHVPAETKIVRCPYREGWHVLVDMGSLGFQPLPAAQR